MKYTKTMTFRFSPLLLLLLLTYFSLLRKTAQADTISIPGAGTYRNYTVSCTTSTDHRRRLSSTTPVCGIYTYYIPSSRGGYCGSYEDTSTIIHRKYENWDASRSSFPDEAYVGITVIVSYGRWCSDHCTVKVISPAMGWNTTCDCDVCSEGYRVKITAYCDRNNIELQPYSRTVVCEPTRPVFFPLDPAKIPLFQTGTPNTKAPSESSDVEQVPDEDDDDDGGLGVGVLAGIAAGAAAVVVIIVGLVVVICLQRRRRRPVSDDGKENQEHHIAARPDEEDIASATAAMTQSVQQQVDDQFGSGAGASATGGSGGWYDNDAIPESACPPPAARPAYHSQQVQHATARPPVQQEQQQQSLEIVAVEEMVEDILKPDGSMVTEITKTTTYNDGSKMVEVTEMPFEGPDE